MATAAARPTRGRGISDFLARGLAEEISRVFGRVDKGPEATARVGCRVVASCSMSGLRMAENRKPRRSRGIKTGGFSYVRSRQFTRSRSEGGGVRIWAELLRGVHGFGW